jgi:hypothetical protein
MELAIGIVVGGLISWALSHYYYRKQTKAQINPIPYIQEVNRAIVELYVLAIQRSDEELKKNVRNLVEAMETYVIKMADDLTLATLTLDLIVRANIPGNEQKLLSNLKRWNPRLVQSRDRLQEVYKGYIELRQTAKMLLKR